jgi:translocation and assembly module TamB
MALTSVVDGIDFSQGRLRARLDGQGLVIDEFSLRGAGGSAGGQATVSGSVLWPAASAAPLASRLRMTLKTELKALRLSTRAERRLSLSGQLDSQLQDAVLTVRGKLQADEAMFILPDDTTPQLGDDVLVRSSGSQAHTGQPVAASTDTPALLHITPDVNVTLDLGRNFQLRGRGLVSRLAGSLELRSGAERGQAPRLTGELRAVMGTYQAYGQQLDIEQGVLRFNGPYDNPALNILALRPNLQQRVGVQISGTALAPVVRLYSEPDLPDAEKLSWLVLGHSAANGGAESAMLQQAALALLGSKGKGLSGGVAQALGLDELSVRGGASSNADGSSTTGATVTLGKRVSRNFYVAYERSLAGTLGTFYIFYDLSRRITLRAQTGEQSAVDLIFTLRYD